MLHLVRIIFFFCEWNINYKNNQDFLTFNAQASHSAPQWLQTSELTGPKVVELILKQ